MMYDFVIKNGTVIDGLGGEPFQADVVVHEGRIVEVGKTTSSGRQEIDAKGKLVTPGFVDIHTHYDGQATWSNRLSPSSEHGVTTVVMGNCGVGFAPCRKADRESLIVLMEGVEDIPGVVMSEGIPWAWETFPEFMDFLGSREYDMDIAAQLPHAPLRVYTMGQRGIDREPATDDDIQQMRDLTAEAIRAGALGVATSRSLNHRSSDQHLMPGVSAAEGELLALGEGINDAGLGVLQCISDFSDPESDFGLLRRIVESTGLSLSYSLMQVPNAPDRWRTILDLMEKANQQGLDIKAQVFPRPIGVVLGLELAWNFFSFSPSYIAISHLPLDERLRSMRLPEVRRNIIAEFPTAALNPLSSVLANLRNVSLVAEKNQL